MGEAVEAEGPRINLDGLYTRKMSLTIFGWQIVATLQYWCLRPSMDRIYFCLTQVTEDWPRGKFSGRMVPALRDMVHTRIMGLPGTVLQMLGVSDTIL